MVDIDSMGRGLQLVAALFSSYLLGKVSLEFKLHGMSIWLGTLGVLHILCIC